MFFKIDYSKLPKLKLYLEINLGNLWANYVSLLTNDVQTRPQELRRLLLSQAAKQYRHFLIHC